MARSAPHLTPPTTRPLALVPFTWSVTWFACLACLSCLAGCGRKATEADCTLILDRNVEVAMKAMNVTDAVSVQKRKDEIRGEMKSDMKDCVGRRITDVMLACVRKAETADGIDSCMR